MCSLRNANVRKFYEIFNIFTIFEYVPKQKEKPEIQQVIMASL